MMDDEAGEGGYFSSKGLAGNKGVDFVIDVVRD